MCEFGHLSQRERELAFRAATTLQKVNRSRSELGETFMIEISHVDKWYGPSFQALKDCTTSVAKGEVVVVCGPSGSGKSTLIKCVNAPRPRRAEGPRPQISGRIVRRTAAARGDCPRAGDGPDRDAVRRADLGARSRNDQRGARRDGRPRPRGHDHDGRD